MGFSGGAEVGEGKNGPPTQPGAGALCPKKRPISLVVFHFISHFKVYFNLFLVRINVSKLKMNDG